MVAKNARTGWERESEIMGWESVRESRGWGRESGNGREEEWGDKILCISERERVGDGRECESVRVGVVERV